MKEQCMCGATDCPVCGPLQGYDDKRDDLEDELLNLIKNMTNKELAGFIESIEQSIRMR